MVTTNQPTKTSRRMLVNGEASRLFDRQVRATFGFSGKEFIRRWERGDYKGKAEDTRVTRLAMLLPFAAKR